MKVLLSPRFLQNHVFAVMKGNMSFQNDGADVLSCDYFQVDPVQPRGSPGDAWTATAALTLPESAAKGSAYGRYSNVCSGEARLRHVP